MYVSQEDYQNFITLGKGIKYSTMCDIGSMSMDYIIIENGSVEEPIIHKMTDEIIYLIKGALDANISGNNRKIKQGDVVVIKKGTEHTFSNNSGEEAIVISVCNPAYTSDDTYKV